VLQLLDQAVQFCPPLDHVNPNVSSGNAMIVPGSLFNRCFQKLKYRKNNRNIPAYQSRKLVAEYT
jgi:hypothetical protein